MVADEAWLSTCDGPNEVVFLSSSLKHCGAALTFMELAENLSPLRRHCIFKPVAA